MKHREMIVSSRARIDAARRCIAESRKEAPVVQGTQPGKVLPFPVQAAQRERVEALASQITREELPTQYVLFFDTLLRLLDWITHEGG